jgi:hypothetical protein
MISRDNESMTTAQRVEEVPELAVEGFVHPVQAGLSRIDVRSVDVGLSQPSQDRPPNYRPLSLRRYRGAPYTLTSLASTSMNLPERMLPQHPLVDFKLAVVYAIDRLGRVCGAEGTVAVQVGQLRSSRPHRLRTLVSEESRPGVVSRAI